MAKKAKAKKGKAKKGGGWARLNEATLTGEAKRLFAEYAAAHDRLYDMQAKTLKDKLSKDLPEYAFSVTNRHVLYRKRKAASRKAKRQPGGDDIGSLR
jgi:hypothetical protein